MAAFSENDLRQADVAALLKCSTGSARNYVIDLMDAGVIAPSPHYQLDGGTFQLRYRLSSDAFLVNEFREALANPRQSTITRAASVKKNVHLAWSSPPGVEGADQPHSISHVIARRDPLVAALFGAPASSEGRERRAVGQK
jgi:DNA-binding IclR family transcriptional regulator